MGKLLWYETVDGYGNSTGRKAAAAAAQVLRLSLEKVPIGPCTLIHLVDGTTLRAADSIESLAFQIEGCGPRDLDGEDNHADNP